MTTTTTPMPGTASSILIATLAGNRCAAPWTGCSGKGTSNVNSPNVASKRVNGRGERAVVWFQGGDLRCRGCFNLASHTFDRNRDKPVDKVAEWILSCHAIEGATFSGGEPFQQAADLRQLGEYIKLRRPDFSTGVFSGYTLRELVRGQWRWRSSDSGAWVKGDIALILICGSVDERRVSQRIVFGIRRDPPVPVEVSVREKYHRSWSQV